MIKIYQKTVKDTRVRSLKQIKVGSWVHVVDPTEEEILQLVNELKLEEGLIEDGLDPFEMPRIEVKKKIVYIFVRFPLNKGVEITTAPALIAVGEDFVATISTTELPFVEKFVKKKSHQALPVDFSTTQKTKLVSTFMSEIVKEYNLFLIQIRREVRSSQVSLDNISNKHIMQLVTIESSLNEFLSALQPTKNILESLLMGKILPITQDKDDIEDLYLSTGQLIESCKSKLKNIINIREAYSTIMTNNLNRILRFFAALTIILTIPNIFGSFFGMNVPIPFAESPYTFAGVAGLALITSLVLYVVFSKNKWL
jgi:magnesium transporter